MTGYITCPRVAYISACCPPFAAIMDESPAPPRPGQDTFMSTTYTILLPDLAATEAFGRRLGALLFPGAVVALVGPLGTGKTHLARAVAEGLGVKSPAAVTSPTFVLIQEYEARLPIYHFDAYRLAGERDFRQLGAHEYFEGDGVCLIEWADRVPATVPEQRLQLTFEVTGDFSRRLSAEARGDLY